MIRCTQILLCILACTQTSCTVIPPLHDPGSAYYDPSTPPQYANSFNSGYLGFFDMGPKHYAIITTDRAKRESEVTPYVDGFGNHIFLLDLSLPQQEYNAKIDAEMKHLERSKSP